MEIISKPASYPKRIVGVDQLRYIFALWVFFAHDGAPPLFMGHHTSQSIDFLTKLYGWSVNGQAAVIGFFIISGLCIHFPNVNRASLDWKSFYIGRLLRLTLPLIVCLIFANFINYTHNAGFLHVVPIWTLYCEALYYFAYPIIIFFVNTKKIGRFILFTSLISFAFILYWSSDRGMYFQEIGGNSFFCWKPALLAFPCWLSGLLLAERIRAFNIDNFIVSNLLRWRIGALLLSTLIFPLYRVGLHLHITTKPIIGLLFTSQFTLLLFGIYAFFWIEKEMLSMNFSNNRPSPILEKLGTASYSLYLIHISAIWLFSQIDTKYFLGYLINWLLLFAFVHAMALIFYILVEQPSHQFAKVCSNTIKKLKFT
jgi:peptidoglycan/LPS O-acetylase OafA/YrhL